MENLTSQTPETPSSSKKSLTKIIVGIFVILILLGAGYLVYHFLNTATRISGDLWSDIALQEELQVLSKDLPISKVKGVPIEKDGKLYIYYPDTKQTKFVKNGISFGGESEKGESGAMVSPNLLYTAVLGTSGGELSIISNESLEVKIVAKRATYYTDWSPDSRYLLYYAEPITISHPNSDSGGMGDSSGDPISKVKFDNPSANGYFIFDMTTGKTLSLYPLERAIGFIDNHRILTRQDGESDQLIVFDLDSFEADYKFVKDSFGFGAGQFDFSPDGKKWTFTLSRNPTTDANIILADFPQKEGVQIDTGAWAEIQSSFVSPDVSKVVYQRSKGMIDGFPQLSLMVYDVKSKTKQAVADGMPLMWLDNDNVLVNAGYSKADFSVVNVVTGDIQKIQLPN